MLGAESKTEQTGTPPSIIFLVRSFERGGAERQLVTLVPRLKAMGWSVSVACFYAGGPLQVDLEASNVRIHDLNKRGRWDVVGFLLRFIRLARSERPDMVHSYLPMANIVALLARLGHRETRIVWGIRASEVDLLRYDLLARLEFYLQCGLSRFVDGFISNSRAGLQYHLERGFPPDRGQVIPNGIDIDKFRFSPDGREDFRMAWGILKNAPTIGLVGRVDPMKGYEDFLDVASRLSADHSDWRFVCIGGGASSYWDELRGRARDLGLKGRLIWAGACDRMPEAYSALDVVVSCSKSEGFPNVIGEAMACGRPCVVTDVGDSASIVAETGAVVSAGNTDALAREVQHLAERACSSGREELSEAVRSRIEREFSVQALTERTARVLMNIKACSVRMEAGITDR